MSCQVSVVQSSYRECGGIPLGQAMGDTNAKFDHNNIIAGVCAALIALLGVSEVTRTPSAERWEFAAAAIACLLLGGVAGGLAILKWNRGERVASRVSIAATTGIALITVRLVALLGPSGQAVAMALLAGALSAVAILFRPKASVARSDGKLPPRPDS